MRLEFAIDIHRPPRDVFAVVGNLENDPKWQAAVIAVSKITAGPIAEGARFRHVVSIMGRKTAVDIEFLHYQEGERYVLNCSAGMLVFNTEVRFDPIVQGTRLVTLVAGNPKGLLKLAAVTLSHHRRHEIEADMHNLKQLMESRAL
jgi:carbon monoxide dehydrogenase subunit G